MKDNVIRPRLLVVDDDQRNIRVIEAMLGSENYLIEGVGSGADALQKIAREAPDLILMDIMMPEMNGFEMLEKLKAQPGLRNIPIIVVTSLDDRESHRYALQAGADEVVIKPVDRSELLLRVKNLIDLGKYRKLTE